MPWRGWRPGRDWHAGVGLARWCGTGTLVWDWNTGSVEQPGREVGVPALMVVPTRLGNRVRG
ncbi:MAG: hypothetical protein OXH56_10275 [Gemmatimonadetes bacterium]|nr:hypothetical protein [Gemmatimonadota bacterium]